MNLQYGVIPQEMVPPRSMPELIGNVDALVRERGYAANGDRVVVVAGASMGTPSTLNGIILHTVGEDWNPELTCPVDPAEADSFPRMAIEMESA